MPPMKPIQIVGFTPLAVILAERFTYSTDNKHTHISLVEQISSLTKDTHWQSVSLLCLLNLLKQCRMLQSDSSKKFGVNVQRIHMNEQVVYSYIKLVTQRVQNYYLNLLRQREVNFELFDDQTDNDAFDEHEFSKEKITKLIYLFNNDLTLKKPWRSYFRSLTTSLLSIPNEHCSTYVTYGHSSHPEFDQSLRVHSFQYLLQYPTLKLIGPDIFAFELAHLLSSLGQNQVYLYRMNPSETSMIPITETNANLVTLFQVFSKFLHEPLLQLVGDEKHRPTLHIIEQFHQFKMNLNADGQLEYEKFTEPIMPMSRTSDETKKNKRTYLETFRQRTQESTIKFSRSNIHIDSVLSHETSSIKDKNHEEPLDHFPPSSTFFVLTDVFKPTDIKTHRELPPFPKAIRTFNSSPSSLIQNIYETLRTISGEENIPHLINLFLSVDQELCVLKNPIPIKNGEFGMDETIESHQHDLQRPIENLHDLHKIIQRPVNPTGQLALYESQLFQNDALDLQSLLLLFNSQDDIPKNELMFLFRNEYDWHNLLVLPDGMTIKNNNRRHESTL